MNRIAALCLSILMLSGCNAVPRSAAVLPGFTFERYQLSGSPVRFYLAPSTEGPRPLLVVVQGSGCEALFVSRTNPQDHTSRLAATAAQDIIQKIAAGRFAVLVVEKPGVASETAADESAGGTSGGCSEEFKRAHSLAAWTHTLSLAIEQAKKDPRVQGAAGIRLMGLSEGAITVARLARERTDVSHVAFISGFGCDQWRDVLVVARREAEAEHKDVARAVAEMEAGLAKIAADPLNADALFEDQTYLYWSTFGRACPAADLAASDAQVFVATGTADEQIDANGVEAIPAARIAAGKTVTMRRILGGSHVLNTPGTKPFENLMGVFGEAMNWMADQK